MILTNAFRPDTRVLREAKALVHDGYSVNIICWDRKIELPPEETVNGFQVNRIHSIQSVYGAGWRQLQHLPKFWNETIKYALEYKPDLVHCHDFDTLYAGVKLKNILGCKLTYDAHENYPALMSLHLPKILVFILKKWEKRLIKFTDAVITASTVLRDDFLDLGISPVITLGNFQDTDSYTGITDAEIKNIREKINIPKDSLSIAYIGGFSNNRLILPFIETAKKLPEVHFHIWGDGHQRDDIEHTSAKLKNVTYHGWLSPYDIPLYFKSIDIIYYCLRLDYPGAVYNAPNTLGQAMAAGRPIIANKVGDLGRIVNNTGCGILLEEVNTNSIKNAITKLMNPVVRQEFGNKGLKSAKKIYNSQSINQQLIEIYNKQFSIKD